MATYLVWSGGDGTAPSGTDWTKAATTLQAALTLATTANDVVKVHYTHTETPAGITLTFAANVAVISVNKDSSDAPTAMASTAGIQSTGNVVVTGAFRYYFYGFTIIVNAAAVRTVMLADADGSHAVYESCYLALTNASSSTSQISGSALADRQSFLHLKNCSLKFSATGNKVKVAFRMIIEGGSLINTGTIPTALFTFTQNDPAGCTLDVLGWDGSYLGSNTLVDDSTTSASVARFSQCKLGSGYAMLATQTNLNRSSAEVYVFDCSSGDIHGLFGYQNAMGSVVSDTGIYVTASPNSVQDGATAKPSSWKITTTAYCSFYTPFETPWLGYYNSTLSAITPYVEILRTGADATGQDEDIAFDDDEVWCNMMAKTTSGSTVSTLYTNRMTLLGTPAAQTTSSLTASDWTGELAEDWYGKLDVTFTPAEVGHVQCRVCVGIETVLYLDPQIRT